MPKVEMIIQGEGVAPETLTMSEIAALLRDWDKALTDQARHSGAPDIRIDDIRPRLSQITAGSLVIEGILPETYPLKAWEDIVAGLQGDAARLAEGAREALDEIWRRVAKRKWRATARVEGTTGTIVLDENVSVPKPAEITEYTTVYGVLTSIGGSDPPRATLRLPDGSRLTVNLTRSKGQGLEMARQLAHRLYQIVGIRGKATVRLTDHAIVQMLGLELVPYAPSETTDELVALLQRLGKNLPPPSKIEEFFAKVS